MPKYQIVLQNDEQIASDEFYALVRLLIDRYFHGFKILEARNLQGIRPEVWQQPKQEFPEFL